MFKSVLNLWNIAAYALRILRRAAWLLLVAFLLRFSTLPLGEPWARIGVMVSEAHFDYIGWTLNAMGAKAVESLYGAHPFMGESERSDFARVYFADLARAQQLEREVEAIYADPNIPDSDAASAALRAERDALRADLAARQSLAEAIIEGQVAAVLVEEGYGVAGQLVPPIAMRFSPAPTLLVISARDKIEIQQGINLYALPVDERAALEAEIDAREDVASLIVPLGGIALYPALILETSDLRWAVETFAHEWFHHYLFLFPLGQSLDFASESRLINESAANMFGDEIAAKVYARYYPEFGDFGAGGGGKEKVSTENTEHTEATERKSVSRGCYALSTPHPQPPRPQGARGLRSVCSLSLAPCGRGTACEASRVRGSRPDKFITGSRFARPVVRAQTEPPPFDFGAAMNETRVTVDALLAEGKIGEAEAYMAERQALFFANGYQIRKLNQAYFAFYGGYQVGGVPGIAGEDPIGPALRDIRDTSPTLHDFSTAIRGITTRAELLAARDAITGGG